MKNTSHYTISRILNSFMWKCTFGYTYVHIWQNRPLFYYVTFDVPEDDHVETETCSRHTVQGQCFFLFLVVQALEQIMYDQSNARKMESIKFAA